MHRNKYNTMTPAEAKKLNRYLSGVGNHNNGLNINGNNHHHQPGRPPVRTASVLHKPRPPPMVVTNLDDYGLPATSTNLKPKLPATNGIDDNYVSLATNGRLVTDMPYKYSTLQTRSSNFQNANANSNVGADRCTSSCSNHSYSAARYQRHSINLGSRSYGYQPGANGVTNTNININNNDSCAPTRTQLSSKGSPTNDSESNLSFRSSLDVIDSAYGSDRFQTMSVDLGNPQAQSNKLHLFANGIANSLNNGATINRYHDNNKNNQYCDSYGQEQNKLSDESFSSAVSQQSESVKNKLKSASKISLTSSTTKVFQNQLLNLKKFFRYMPIKRSENETNNASTPISDKKNPIDLGESISQFCLDRSQSPPVCPPPPGELKSMSYMENSVNYSNYDEFTRARNEKTSALLSSNHLRNGINGRQTLSRDYRGNNPAPLGDDYSLPGSEDADSWHLASLPVSYERNLTTVFEEKPNGNACKVISGDNKTTTYQQQVNDAEDSISKENCNNGTAVLSKNGKNMIKPPANFDDKGYETAAPNLRSSTSNTNSSQSLNSITSNDSVLDFHRQTNSSFRFSYGQPNAYDQGTPQRNTGLPPRMPTSESKVMTNGNSTANNGVKDANINNNCETDKTSIRDCPLNDTNVTNGVDTDPDSTILSDTSTINGDSNHLTYVNKCAELASTIESLKNKLITKEKELTDLQLKQWSSDYLIDQLKSTIGRLEKENAQLKTVAAKASNRVNNL